MRAGIIHGGGSVEEGFDVDATHRGGEEAHWREDTEAAADTFGDGEGGDVFGIADLPHGSLFGIGDGDDVLGVVVAEGFLEEGAGDKELGGGLGGLTGFADDINEGVFEVGIGAADFGEGVADEEGIDIVENEDAGMVLAGLAGHEVPVEGIEGLLEGDVAESAAADAEDDEVFFVLMFLYQSMDGLGVLLTHGSEGEEAPAFPVRAFGLVEAGGEFGALGQGAVEIFGGDAVFADAGGEEVLVI